MLAMAFCISFNGKGSDCPIRPSCLHGGFKAWIWARAGFIEHVTMISRICEFAIRCEFEASKVGTIKSNNNINFIGSFSRNIHMRTKLVTSKTLQVARILAKEVCESFNANEVDYLRGRA